MNAIAEQNEVNNQIEAAPAPEQIGTDAGTVAEPAPEQYPARLIDRACDVGDFASKDETRSVLQSINFTRQGVEATNGRILIRVPYAPHGVEEFPPCKVPDELHPVNANDKRTLATVPVKAVRDALKNAPKESTLPVLSCVKVGMNGDGKVHLGATDLETDKIISVKPIEGNYPNTDAVWPTEPAKFSISLAAEYVKLIADYAIKHGHGDGHHAIRFDFTDEMGPVRFSTMIEPGRTAAGVLMPMRMS